MTTADAYHYTTAAGVLGILDSKRLRLTDVQFLNDTRELGAVEDLAQHLRSQATGMSADWDNLSDSDQFLAQRLDAFASVFTDLARRRFTMARAFVACFCRSGDRLSQWRGYAGSADGYAIGFDWERLGAAAIHKMPEGAPRVARNVLAMHVSVAQWQLGQADVRYPSADVLSAELEKLAFEFHNSDHLPQFVDVVQQLASVKHPAFSEEEERRLIAIYPDASPPDVSVRPGRFGLIPFVEAEFPVEAIREIVVGPVLPSGAEMAVRDLLRWKLGRNVADSIKVRRSEATYR
ncbi:DUF2971 domain-containing protein [Leifsonia aquatica]|uniref:DUF2971 domain-containing protein n=1 Tax=Leifsonia aquatica TaxID=144185 RepID=UPI003828AF2D